MIEALVEASGRHPDEAVGFCGYSLLSPPYRHPNLRYYESTNHSLDQRVHVLGGMFGVAYRSGFFDLRRLTSYGEGGSSGAGFFVDDDWIAAALDHAGVGRVVLGHGRGVDGGGEEHRASHRGGRRGTLPRQFASRLLTPADALAGALLSHLSDRDDGAHPARAARLHAPAVG